MQVFMLKHLKTNQYLVVTPNSYHLCNDVKHITNSIKQYCNYLNTPQKIQNFDRLISRHIKREDWKIPIKKQQYIKEADIYVIKLTSNEIRMFY